MKYIRVILFCCIGFLMLSCEDDEKQRQAEAAKAQKVNDSILKIISSNWKFDVPAVTSKVSQRIENWNEWQQFKNEFAQNPTGTLGAYRQKVKTLVNKAEQLKNNIPPFFDKPQVRSRIGVLITKVKSLYTYININPIPEKKVMGLLNEVSGDITSFQNQLDELVRISEVPKEIGEEEMLRALDTVRRANPDFKAQPEDASPAPAAPASRQPFNRQNP
jgi:archaellum component FlaC